MLRLVVLLSAASLVTTDASAQATDDGYYDDYYDGYYDDDEDAALPDGAPSPELEDELLPPKKTAPAEEVMPPRETKEEVMPPRETKREAPAGRFPRRDVDDREPITGGAALGWSLGATFGGIVASVGLLYAGDNVGDYDAAEALFTVGSLLMGASVLVGPSAGLMAAGAHGRAWAQFGIRGGLYGGAVSCLYVALLSAFLAGNTAMAGMFLIAGGVLGLGGVGMAVYSIIDGYRVADARYEQWEAKYGGPSDDTYGVMVVPWVTRDGGGLALGGRF